MRIGILTPSIFMSAKKYGEMIFAPRQLAIELTNGLVKRGNEVFFFATSDTISKARLIPGEDFFLQERAGIAPLEKEISTREFWGSFYANKRNFELDLTRKAYLFAKEGRVDIIHCFHENLAHFFDGLVDVPTVYTLHDPLPSEGLVSHFLFNSFCNHNFISISFSQQKGSDLKLNFVGNVYNGVDVKDYIFGQEKGSYLAFIGRMVPKKGVDLAIELSEKMKFPLRIASSKDPTDMDNQFYEGKVGPLLRKGNVIFEGILHGGEKIDFLKKAMLLIFPIKWEEPFGLVMIEAMACGTPVVAFARGSVPEVIKDGETGFIVNFSEEDKRGDFIIKKTGLEGLCEAVERIYAMPREEYKKMRLASRKHVEKNFTVEKMVEGYEKIYEKVISRQGTS